MLISSTIDFVYKTNIRSVLLNGIGNIEIRVITDKDFNQTWLKV